MWLWKSAARRRGRRARCAGGLGGWRIGRAFAALIGGQAGHAETPRTARPRATKPRRLVRFFRPLALVIVRLEYAPRGGRP